MKKQDTGCLLKDGIESILLDLQNNPDDEWPLVSGKLQSIFNKKLDELELRLVNLPCIYTVPGAVVDVEELILKLKE